MKRLSNMKRVNMIGGSRCSQPHLYEVLFVSSSHHGQSRRSTVRCFGNSNPHTAGLERQEYGNEKDASSVSVPFRLSQEGKATLVARVSQNATRLQVAHKSPCRWIPMITSQNSTVAKVALGHYGGGMADGDSATIDITVQDGAFLRCTTQGTNRIYKKRMGQEGGLPTQMKTIVRCGSNSTCWMTPDPTQLQKSARFHQKTRYELQDSSSLIAIDWISAGRLTAGERWDHELCRLRTIVSINGHVHFIDAQDLSPRFCGMDWNDVQLQTFGTVILYNVESEVIDRFRQMQHDLCASYTAVRTGNNSAQNTLGAVLSGRVLLGMNFEDASSVHVVRFAAESNEDVYRLLNWAIGNENGVYEERIRAVQSASPVWVVSDSAQPAQTKSQRKHVSFSASPGVLLMADSMFPIGSFAHSLGLESASQLGLIYSKQQVIHYLQAALLSNVQQSVPLIRYSTRKPSEWQATNAYAECLLSSNPPAYRASIEQAKNLSRIMEAVSNGFPNELVKEDESVVHFAPLFGQAAFTTFGVGEMEACHAFAYAIARDLVSAAVRMNLLGPMEGQAVLWNDLLPLMPELCCMDHSLIPRLDDAATCAPSLEAIQPCHDLLATRLFRS